MNNYGIVDDIQRIMTKYVRVSSDGCWLWEGHSCRGYGSLSRPGGFETISAHKYFYTELIGPVPVGYDLHHTCLTTLCCNPWHLELVDCHEHKRLYHPKVCAKSAQTLRAGD